MTLQIEGYDLNQLAALGKQVETVDTRKLSISGDAQAVAQTFLVMGLFGQVVAELQKRVPVEKEPVTRLTREQENAAIGLGISTEEALAMANGEPENKYKASAVIPPNEMLPFGFVLPVDAEARDVAIKHLRWVLHSTFAVSSNGANMVDQKFVKWMTALYDALEKILTKNEMSFLFAGAQVGTDAPTPKFQFIYPTREVPFGYVFPVADPNSADSVMVREHALRNFNVMLHEYVRGTIGWEKSSGNFNRTTINQTCKRAEQLWNVCKPILNKGELAMAFRGTIDRYGKCTYRAEVEKERCGRE